MAQRGYNDVQYGSARKVPNPKSASAANSLPLGNPKRAPNPSTFSMLPNGPQNAPNSGSQMSLGQPGVGGNMFMMGAPSMPGGRGQQPPNSNANNAQKPHNPHLIMQGVAPPAPIKTTLTPLVSAPKPVMRRMAESAPQSMMQSSMLTYNQYQQSQAQNQQQRGFGGLTPNDSRVSSMQPSAEFLGLQQQMSASNVYNMNNSQQPSMYSMGASGGSALPMQRAATGMMNQQSQQLNPYSGMTHLNPQKETPVQAPAPAPAKKSTSGSDIIDIEKYSKLVGWDRMTRAPDDVVIGLLNAIYDNVIEMATLTSEKRIFELVKLLKEYLNLLLIPTYEFQKYFEQYLKRLIKDKKWISLTVSQSLCISVTAPDEEIATNRKFFCNYCTLSYSNSLFTCNVCQSAFKHIVDLQAHEFQAHNICNSVLFVCDICQKSFPRSPLDLRDHMYEKHICRRKHLECPFGCEKLILEMSEHSFKDHIKALHQCSQCKDAVQGSMENHVKMFHNEQRARKKSHSPERRQVATSSSTSRMASSSASRERSSLGSLAPRPHRDNNDDELSGAGRWDRDRGRSSPPMNRDRSPPSSRKHGSAYGGIDDMDVLRAQETLREMQRAKELVTRDDDARIRDRDSGEYFNYFDPPVKSKWPQCKQCKLYQPPGGFKCNKCQQTFQYRVLLFKHMKEVHKMKMMKAFECEMCAKVFSDLNILLYHVTKEAHVCAHEHLQCTYGCLNLFQNKHSLTVHTDAKHEFMCHICEAPIVNQTKKKHFTLYHPGEKFLAPTENQVFDPKTSSDHHMVASNSMSEVQTLTLAPRLGNRLRQSFLTLATNRQELFLADPPPILSENAFSSRSKTQLANMGFMFCKHCELVYHPELTCCKRCNSLFLNSAMLTEHQVEVHKLKEGPFTKECSVVTCGAKFSSFSQLVNHQVEHYCHEHTECPFGCKCLISGSVDEVIHHCKRAHPGKEIPRHITESGTSKTSSSHQETSVSSVSKFVGLHKLHQQMEERNKDKEETMEIEVTLKCINCEFVCTEDSLRVCDHCPPSDAFKCADGDELRGHLSSYHKLFIRGDFVCDTCSNKRGAPLKFVDDVVKYLEHRKNVHGICEAHDRCPNSPCLTLFDPKTTAADKHLRLLCPHMKEPPRPDISEGDEWKSPGWKLCIKCRYAFEVSKLYICENCESPIPFFSKDEYYAHLVVVHRWKTDYIFACFVCNSQFASNGKAWLNHRESVHKICDQHLVCSKSNCQWMAPNKSEIERHLHLERCEDNKVSGVIEETKICHACSQIFSADGVIFQCTLCTRNKQQFMSALEFLVHLENIHDRKIKGNFGCLECSSFTTNSPYGLSRHNYLVHKKCHSHRFCPNDVKCSVVFPTESYSMQHQCMFAKTSPLKTLQSPIKALRRVGERKPVSKIISLNDDSMKEDSKELVEGKCVDCGFQVLPEAEELSCSICTRTFINKAELCAHMKTEHQSIVRGQFECEVCSPSQMFVDSPDALLDHYETEHKFCRNHKKCADCSALLSSKTKMETHMTICPKSKKPKNDKFFEGIGALPKLVSEPVKVVNLSPPKTVIEVKDSQKSNDMNKNKGRTVGDSSSSNSSTSILARLKSNTSTGHPKLASKYKYSTEGKTKLFVCKHCNYTSMMPPPGRFKGDMKCRQKDCSLIFHQKFELVAHLELAHDKPLPPIKAKMVCEFCRDEKARNPFSHSSSVPMCEHKKLAHGCCRTHIVCPESKCSYLFPTRDALDQHRREKNCEALFVAIDDSDKDAAVEKVESWGKSEESLKKPKTDPKSGKKFTCNSCDVVVYLDFLSTSHCGSFTCQSCEKKGLKLQFLFKFELLAHILRDHSINKDGHLRFTCDACTSQKSIAAISLVAHRKTAHNFCKVHYRCAKGCSVLFNNDHDLKKHEEKCDSKATSSSADADSEKEKKVDRVKSSKDIKAEKIEAVVEKYGSKESHVFQLYECSTCSRKFGCTNIYKCNQCPDTVSISSRSFVNLVEFFSHLHEAHKIDTEVKHSCALCDRFDATAHELQAHVQQKHKVCGHHYMCPKLCKSLFDDKQKLLTHIQGGCPSSSTSDGNNKTCEKRKEIAITYDDEGVPPSKKVDYKSESKSNSPNRQLEAKAVSSEYEKSSTDVSDNVSVAKPAAKWDDMMALMLDDVIKMDQDEQSCNEKTSADNGDSGKDGDDNGDGKFEQRSEEKAAVIVTTVQAGEQMIEDQDEAARESGSKDEKDVKYPNSDIDHFEEEEEEQTMESEEEDVYEEMEKEEKTENVVAADGNLKGDSVHFSEESDFNTNDDLVIDTPAALEDESFTVEAEIE